MSTIYLETSFVSACVTDRNDASSVYRRDVSMSWWETQRRHHNLVLSDAVIAELSQPGFRRREEALQLVHEVAVLRFTPDAEALARVLMRELVMPNEGLGDAAHVAIAACSGIDLMLTWNVRHLANINKQAHLRAVCLRCGYIPPAIVTPDLLLDPSP